MFTLIYMSQVGSPYNISVGAAAAMMKRFQNMLLTFMCNYTLR